MKKSFAIIVALLLFVTVFAGCVDSSTDISSEPPAASSETGEMTQYEKASALLNEGKFEEAYKCFYSIRNQDGISEILAKFKICISKTVKFDSYGKSESVELTFDSNGNIKTEVRTDINGIAVKTEYDYDQNGHMSAFHSFDNKGNPIRSEYRHDSQGRLLELRRYNCFGEIYEEKKNIYNENGDLVYSSKTDVYGLVETTEKEFNAYGDPIIITSTNKSGKVFVSKYEYDERQNLIKLTTKSDNYFSYVLCTYDEEDNRIKEEIVSNNGEKTVNEYEYDSTKRITKQKVIDSSGSVTSDEYVYDADGNKIKIIRINKTGSVSEYDYKFDKNGNLILETHRIDDKISYSRSLTYNDANNLLRDILKNERGKLLEKSDYMYDNDGNCTQKSYYRSELEANVTCYYVYDDVGNLVLETATNNKNNNTRTIAEYSGFSYFYFQEG